MHGAPQHVHACAHTDEGIAMLVSATDRSRGATAQFASSGAVALLVQLGISHEVASVGDEGGLARVRSGRGSEILWHRGIPGAPRHALIDAEREPITIFARILGDVPAGEILGALGGSWTRTACLRDGAGAALASIWRERDGSVFLPFDPDEVCLSYWSESYQQVLRTSARRMLQTAAMRAYYTARGMMPRPLQIALRRAYARRQARTEFPRWPVETALHDFQALFTAMLVDVAGEPVARIASWPHGHRWAFVLTHDVETAAGVAAVAPVVAIERELGLRSVWNFVPRRYEVGQELVRELTDAGFEVGVHGLYHDGRDLESAERLHERLPAIREAAARWGASGFRAPATQRGWDLMAQLGFDYDSSYPDSDPFEPQGGGCCTWLPFFNRELVELPLTMPQDHTLFTILRRADAATWIQKAELLRDRGGMALIDTHPDYLVDERILNAYTVLLERFASDGSAWHALPREVSSWWRRRAASVLRRDGDEWTLDGPAGAEARVETLGGERWR